MSIETRLEELTKAINELPNALAAVLANSANPLVVAAADQPVKEMKTDSDQEAAAKSDTTSDSSDNSKDTGKSGGEIAGRKTYVFNKTTKTGQIIEKGEEIPEGDEFVKVGKTNWEKMCDKHGLDVATGQPVPEEEPEEEDDDLDLGDDTEEESDDDDLGLDDDEEDEGGITVDEVKAIMVRVMREVGREDAVKVFKKFGARNIGEVAEKDLQACHDLAEKVLKKAGK